MKAIYIQAKSFVLSAVYLFLAFSSSSVVAEGPVGVASLPGGVNFVDQGDGTGESWGRAGGVNWNFNNFDLSRFDSLIWGAIDTLSVGIALDGTINSGTQEYLSFSSINGNQALWVGETQVSVYSGTTMVTKTVDTRFVLTVTAGGGPLPLQTSTINSLPRVNVFTANGQFVANLKMEAKFPNAVNWEGALDFFDRLNTTGDGLAITSFNHGFFFELVGGGTGELALAEHDSNMVSQTAKILGDLDFLTIESVNRLKDLGITTEQLLVLNNRELFELQKLIDLHEGGAGVPSSNEIRQIVSESRQELINIIVFLWGLSPGGEGFPDPADVPQISELSTQASVDTLAGEITGSFADQSTQLTEQAVALTELKQKVMNLKLQLDEIQAKNELSLEVISSNEDSDDMRRLLVLVRENSVPINTGRFLVNAVIESESQGFELISVAHTDRNVGDGLFEITLDDSESLESVSLFHIVVEHNHEGGATHRSATIFEASDDD